MTRVAVDSPTRRVAVLGGTGWVGRHLCDAFARQGYGVVAVARNPAAHVAAHRFVPLDLAGAPTEVLAELLHAGHVGIVVNAFDSTNTTDGWQRTDEEHHRVNITTVERLLAAAGTLPWRVRMVHLGTIHEYGPVPSGTAIAETLPARPVNGYARSKLGGSEAVLRADTVDGIVLRLVNLCGPHPAPDSFPGKLLRLFSDARGTGAATVTITRARRDFVDVRDVVAAVLAAAATGGSGRVVNIGTGEPVEIERLVRILADEAGITGLTIHNGPVASVDGDWITADVSLAGDLLDWRPTIGIRESLRDMWRSSGH